MVPPHAKWSDSLQAKRHGSQATRATCCKIKRVYMVALWLMHSGGVQGLPSALRVMLLGGILDWLSGLVYETSMTRQRPSPSFISWVDSRGGPCVLANNLGRGVPEAPGADSPSLSPDGWPWARRSFSNWFRDL